MKRINSRHIISGLAISAAFIACGDDMENGNGNGNGSGLSTLRMGDLVADGAGGAPDATGSVSIAEDADGNRFIVLGDDFMQEMGPGDTQLILAATSDNVQSQRDTAPSTVSDSLGVIPNGASGARTVSRPVIRPRASGTCSYSPRQESSFSASGEP